MRHLLLSESSLTPLPPLWYGKRRFGAWLSLLFLAVYASDAVAVDPSQHLSDLNYSCWSFKEGAPQSVYALAQSSDGYLWLGTGTGLISFDGVQFELFTAADGTHPITDTVSTIYPDLGQLWVGTRFGVAFAIKKGGFTRYDAKSGLPAHTIFAFARTGDGILWAQTQVGLYRLEGAAWKPVGAEWGYPFKEGENLAVDGHGSLWSRRSDGTSRLDPGSHKFSQAPLPGGNGGLFVTPSGDVWASDGDRGLIKASDPSITVPGTKLGGVFAGLAPAVVDDAGALWTQIDAGKDIATVRIPSFDKQISGGGKLAFESLIADQSSGCRGQTGAIIQDREGGIWRAAPTGLD